MKNFALIGAAGYVAPRHMKAIKDTGNRLVAALDKNDSVGILDSYFPDAAFFTEFERFDRHLEMLRRKNDNHAVQYVGIASPNYLHDAHIRLALRVGADAICEKPLVLNPWNVDLLAEVEKDSGKRVYSILQLRLHPAIQMLKRTSSRGGSLAKHAIDLAYIAGRGNWYRYSWKGDESKSGGLPTNIGIHFFDMLIWVFGAVRANHVHLLRPDRAAGYLELERANVRWFLSLNYEDIPAAFRVDDKRTYRCITIDGHPLEFSEGFAELHTRSYEDILQGGGYGLEESRPAIETVFEIRHATPNLAKGDVHPYLRDILR
jgi:UDP-N-acetyl-2-amino-2-deoxyglucuronate dehydrogenase